MSLPIVAVVGRPNVGKSTFVNRIAQTNEAIVHQDRGVTRDRSYHRAEWNGREFMLIDTGGIEMGGSDAFQASIRNQALVACEESDVVLFMVDGQSGVLADDAEVARILKRSGRPIILMVNKIDQPLRQDQLWEFYQLGLGDPWSLSSLHGYGTGDLLDALVAMLPEEDRFTEDEDDTDEICVAIIGRPNSGKSTLTNRLLGMERSIVSDVAGTTRDAIDSVIDREGQRYRIIDTAGIRRKSQIDADVEYYGFVRALRAIDRADVALLMVDATLGLTDQDQRVAGLAHERGCALVVLVNKWDAVTTLEEREAVRGQIDDRLPFVSYAPVIQISALTGRSTHRIWAAITDAYASYCNKIPTSRLNTVLTELRDFGHTISSGRMRLRINYVTQTGTKPPVFTFFANHPQIIDSNYQRYLENRLRAALPLTGTPIRLRFRKKDPD
jgi:GTP-binding protein